MVSFGRSQLQAGFSAEPLSLRSERSGTFHLIDEMYAPRGSARVRKESCLTTARTRRTGLIARMSPDHMPLTSLTVVTV